MFRLRELDVKDLKIINTWRNDKELVDLLGANFRFINLTVDEKWFGQYLEHRNNTIRCAIVEDDDVIKGLVSLTSIDFLNQSAEFHIMIGDKADQGKGMGTFAVGAMLQHAFCNMNLQRVELTVLKNNERARHTYEKMGFKQEGIKRSAVFKNGKYEDLLLYSILRDEFHGEGGGKKYS